MDCKFPFLDKHLCVNKALNLKNFCKFHKYYENKIKLDDIKWCNIHTKNLLILNDENNYICRNCKVVEDELKKKSLLKICKGINQKGYKCTFQSLDNDDYCSLHQSYKKWKNLCDEGIKVCTNWIRGCFEEINDEYIKCKICRKKDSINDKKLRDTKKEKAIIYNSKNKDKMCYDCNSINKLLFNNYCEPCYKIKLKSSRTRERNDIFKTRLYDYRKKAKCKNFIWNLDDETALLFMKQNCFYCNEKNKINGIDRIDSLKGYFKENCVPCCYQCNSMKSNKNVNDFYKICEHISTNNKLFKGNLYQKLFVKSKEKNYNNYIKESEKRGIDFNLSNEEFNDFLKKECFYCGNFKEGCNGIDRINSDEAYIKKNCISSCSTCNYMKLDFTKEQFINKCLMITFKKNGLLYKTDKIKDEKEKLIELFKNMKPIIETDKDIKYDFDEDYYKKLYWEGDLNLLSKIKIELELVETAKQRDLWKFFRNKTSSLPFQKTSQLVGRQILILVKDNLTNKYLGIISLSSDIMHLANRDDFIGWTSNQRIGEKKLTYLMNLSTCVPLQPFGFNFTGGKLLTKLAFSEEVMNIFEQKYNHKLLGITTTGFHGKSIQYDRLKELKFIGFTKGNSVYKIPNELIEKCQTFLMSEGYNFCKRKKMFIVGQTLHELGLSRQDYMSDIPKGIYFGFCHPKAKDFLTGKIDEIENVKLKNSNIIFKEWYETFAIKRYNNIVKLSKIQSIENYSKPIKKEPINKEPINKEINHKEIYEKNKEYFKKRYIEKKKEKEAIEKIIPTDEIILPKNFTLYEEKDIFYLQFVKSIKGEPRKTAKKTIKTNNLEEEFKSLIKIIKDKYNDYEIEDTKIHNPHLFKLKEVEKKEEQILNTEEKEIPRPILPINYSICKVNDIDYIQFCKKIDNKKYQYKTKINSYDLEIEINNFIAHLNETYDLNLQNETIQNPHNWKTSNKIIIQEDTDEKQKNREKAKKSIEKKKAEIGIEAFNKLKAEQAKERRAKNKELNV